MSEAAEPAEPAATEWPEPQPEPEEERAETLAHDGTPGAPPPDDEPELSPDQQGD